MSVITEKNLVELKKNGFVNIKNFFSKEEISSLLSELNSIYPNTKYIDKGDEQDETQKRDMELTTEKIPYLTEGKFVKGSFGAPVIGCSKLIDAFMQRLFDNKHFQEVCNTFVGKNFKILLFNYRVLNQESVTLPLHQDNFYQFTFQIPLHDIKKNDHSTCFVEGSHLSSFNLLDEMFGVLNKLPNFLFKYFYKKYAAEVGDLSIFINKGYHGTEINKNQNSSKSILIAMNAEGGYLHKRIYIAPEKTKYNENFKLSIGEKIYNRLFDNHYLINFKNQHFTFQNEKSMPTGYITLASNKSTENSVVCLNNANKNNTNYLSQIIFEKQSVSIKTQILVIYLRSLIFAKNIIKKIFKK